MKTLRVTLCALALIMMASSTFAAVDKWFCIVSSDASENDGYCRKGDLGGDICFKTGTGTACSGSDVIIED